MRHVISLAHHMEPTPQCGVRQPRPVGRYRSRSRASRIAGVGRSKTNQDRSERRDRICSRAALHPPRSAGMAPFRVGRRVLKLGSRRGEVSVPGQSLSAASGQILVSRRQVSSIPSGPTVAPRPARRPAPGRESNLSVARASRLEATCPADREPILGHSPAAGPLRVPPRPLRRVGHRGGLRHGPRPWVPSTPPGR
jgi:hypothetical protein